MNDPLAAIIVGLFSHHRKFIEIEGWGRWGRFLPFQSFRAPRIWRGLGAFPPGPCQINDRNQIADAENRCAGARHDVENLKLFRVGMITAWHAQISQDELRKERKIEPDEYHQRSKLGPT